MRTLHLHWPRLSGAADLRGARLALARLSPLVASDGGRLEAGIDGLGDEARIVAAALRVTATHVPGAPRVAVAGSRLLAAIAATPGSGLDAPAGEAAIYANGDEAAALAPLDVALLRLAVTGRSGEEVATALERCALLGVRRIGAFAALREGELVARIGSVAAPLLAAARGLDPQQIEPVPLPRRLVVREPFDEPIASLDALRFPLRRALDALLARARRDGAAPGAVRLHLARERGRSLRVVARLPLPTSDRVQVERLLLAALERCLAAAGRGGDLGADGVTCAWLRLEEVLPEGGEQLTLLGARSPRRDRLAWGMASLALRHGAAHAVRAELGDPDDPRPERRTRLVPLHPEVRE